LKGNDLDEEKYNNQKAKENINKKEKMEEKGKMNDSKTNSKEISNKDDYGKTNSHGNTNLYGYSNSYGYYEYKEKYQGIFGFSNNKLMNNCFMNSSLQNLLHCETFKNLLHSIQDKYLYNKPLTREVKSLITQINNGEDDLDPRNIKSILSNIEEKYKYNKQNDANEFITIFLGELLKELNGIGEYKIEKIPKDELEMKAFYKLEDKFFNKNKSFLLDLFYGRLKRQYICENGHICAIKFNNFNTLILPHPEQSNNLYDLLNLYQKRKMISDTIF
jgi:ubiquitin C-terminal hydrolase